MSRPSTYQPQVFTTPVEVDLSKNEGTTWALAETDLPPGLWPAANKYPDLTALRTVLAQRHGVEPTNVLVTAGGDDSLFRCLLARAGATIVATTPSFEMIRRYAEQTRANLVEVEWWTGPFPIDTFLAQNADMAVLVSPNNPTGSVISADDLRRVAARFDLVILDGAYTEFAEVDLTPAALELDNVVVIRTLSKAYGLAGLRVGYLLGAAERIAEMAAFGSPYSVSGVSAQVAMEALRSNPTPFISRVASEREQLINVLTELGAEPLPSQANFVLAQVADLEWLVRGAAALGVGLRTFPHLDGWVRISLPGDAAAFDRLLDTLRKVTSPEAILFDLDGVIADVSRSYRAAILETAAVFGVTLSDDDILDALAVGDANDDWELTQRLCAAAGVEVPLETITERFEQIYQGTTERPGLKRSERPIVAAEILAELSARMPLGIVTGRPRSDAEEFLERFELTRYFAAVVTRESGPLKPDPSPVRLVLEQLDVERAWMLGDTPDDLEAALAAGVVPVAVVPPGSDPDRYRRMLAGAAGVLDSTNQILEVLNGQKS